MFMATIRVPFHWMEFFLSTPEQLCGLGNVIRSYIDKSVSIKWVNYPLTRLNTLSECFLPWSGQCHTKTSTSFPATVKRKACLWSCHRKRPISREQVPFLFSKTIPMACGAVSCLRGSFRHLQHLAALQHAAAAQPEPTVPLLGRVTRCEAFSSQSYLWPLKRKPTHPAWFSNARHQMRCALFMICVLGLVSNCWKRRSLSSFVSPITAIWMINTWCSDNWCPNWANNICPACDVMAAECSLATLLWQFPSKTRIHFISRGKPGLSG